MKLRSNDWSKPTAVLLVCCFAAAACSDDGADSNDLDPVADTNKEDDVIVWADVAKDSWSPIIDTKAPPKDVGQEIEEADEASPVDVAQLPKPATVPSNLPPGVVGIPAASLELEEDGKTKTYDVNLPSGTVSFLAVVLGKHPGHFTIATAVHSISGLLGKGQCQPLCLSCKNRLAGTAASGAALFPSSSGVKVVGGPWTLSSCGFQWKQEGGSYSVQPVKDQSVDTWVFARVSKDGKVPAAATLKVRVWAAGSISAAASHDHPVTSVMLAEAATILQSAAIDLQILDRINAPKGFATLNLPDGLTTDHSSNADQLFAAAAKVGGAAVVDIFLVDNIVGAKESGADVLGWTGGIPAAAFFPGRPRGGIAIAAKAFKDGKVAGRQLAHEIGHYLGLWNTTNADGNGSDPIKDTPVCPKTADKDNNGVLSAKECEGYDGGNAMFWQPAAGKATFTSGQATILRGNPVLFAK